MDVLNADGVAVLNIYKTFFKGDIFRFRELVFPIIQR